MAIDIFFIIMAAFGFYFGIAFGLIKVVLLVLSILGAVLAAMRFTPMVADLIRETFEVESLFTPFFAFLATLLLVLLLARMLTQMVIESVNQVRLDKASRVIGGLFMMLFFTLLYSVLVTFFGQAHIIDLVFNDEIVLSKEASNIQVRSANTSASKRGVVQDTIAVHVYADTSYYFYGQVMLSPHKKGLSIQSNKHRFELSIKDTTILRTKRELHIFATNQLQCFCENDLMLIPQSDAVLFKCTDDYLSAKHLTSFFYPYIEIIPKKGTYVLKVLAPFIQEFVDYMGIALNRLEHGVQRPTAKPKAVDKIPHFEIEEEIKDSVTVFFDQPKDSLMPPLTPDTLRQEQKEPIKTNTDSIEKDLENIEYEG